MHVLSWRFRDGKWMEVRNKGNKGNGGGQRIPKKRAVEITLMPSLNLP
jgi:hypothetical protein